MPEITEFDIQRALCIWLDTPGVLRPGIVYWHTPNGGSRRDGFEGKRLKQIGLKAGIPDLFFLAGGRLYGLELKKPGGTLSTAQEAMHPRLAAAGIAAMATVDNLADARGWLRHWGLTNC